MTVPALDKKTTPAPGKVVLVGAGPGDPGLLTVTAVSWLKKADIVFHDRLVSQEILDLIPTGTQRVAVGKKPGGHSTPQGTIHDLLAEAARNGQTVVRLKGGDPYVFGRGAEELLAITQAGLPVEVVPGISSALAGPAAAGIPITLRNIAASFAVVTGHRASADLPEPDWSALARIDTLVVLMGIARSADIAEQLMAAGKHPDTPVAVVEKASLPEQRLVRTTLADLAQTIRDQEIEPPAVIVVGETTRQDLDRVLAEAPASPMHEVSVVAPPDIDFLTIDLMPAVRFLRRLTLEKSGFARRS